MLKLRTYCYLVITLSPSLPLLAATLLLPQSPLQSKGYVPPNVMLMMDNSGSMRSEVGSTGVTRMEVAKSVAKEVVEANPDIRFCLAIFNNNQGGQIVNECMTAAESISHSDGSIITNLSGLSPYTWTPLAETYYEVIRYFAGKSSAYNGSTTYTSPIQYRCQKNFTMVLTDGEPTYETDYPDLADMSEVQPITSANYDGNSSNDGDGGSYYSYNYLDDFAKYAWDADLRPSSAGNDLAGKSFQDPEISSGGEAGRQNMYTYTIGFEIDNQMLVDAAAYGRGTFQRADSAADLASTFNSALASISSKSQSISAIAASSSFLATGIDLNIYQSRYLASSWTGELVAWTLDPTTHQLSTTPAWTAPQMDPDDYAQRVIFSGYNNGVVFRKNNFSTDDWTTWFKQGSSNLVPYLRGRAASYITAFDVRPRDSLMGDVINSSPAYVAPPVKGIYRDDSFTDGEKYSEFVTKYENRTTMLFVGANDGMLHGYNAADGSEVLGFYPSAVLPNLRQLADPAYDHQFYVDGTPTVGPVYDHTSKTWRTLLVGGLRRGGQSIYALDISNPSLFTTGNSTTTQENAAKVVHWEFGDNNDVDMGYSYSQPKTMRLGDGKFYVVVGNGYNSTETDDNTSTTGDAVLYLLNVEDGSIKKKISTQIGTAEDPTGRGIGNGLSTVSGYDKTNDGKIDYLYGGDLFGNVWKFDVSDPDSDNWGGLTKLFTACGDDTCKTGATNNNHQPITSPIEVTKTEYGKTMLFFGTGKLLEVIDTLTPNVAKQSFYGLIDDSTSITSRSQLLEQKILYSGKPTIGGVTLATNVRVTTDKKIKTQKGWFMDIQVPSYEVTDTLQNIVNESNVTPVYSLEGEQVLAQARYSKGVISFFTKAASNQFSDPCADISTTSFTMELNALSGSRLGTVRTDVNNDGVIDEKDSIDTGKKNTLDEKVFVVISGKAGGNGSGSLDIHVTDSSGNQTDQVISVNGPGDDPGEGNSSKTIKSGYRESWREITND